jgi:hypothetical protein
LKCSRRPGERVSGALEWEQPAARQAYQVRLTWFTGSKGAVESHTVERQEVLVAGYSGRATFSLPLPELPYSFAAKLVHVFWVVEAGFGDAGHDVREAIVVSPTGEEIQLHR